jgi:hypothetical protein
MARWSSQCRLFALAFVALSCSDCGAHAFALCEGCPELFAKTPIAQQAALPKQRAQSTHLDDRYVNRRWHLIRRDGPRPPLLARRTALTAFAVETAGLTPSQLKDRGLTDAIVTSAIADPAPLVADAAMPATPALRIDELFNIMAAGPSDQPDEVAAMRANVLSQFLMRLPSPDPEESTGFFIPTLIAFAGGLLVGVVLVSARRHAFALPRTLDRQRGRPLLLRDRARRLTRGTIGISPKEPTVSPGVRERLTVLSNQAGTSPAGVRSRSGMVERHPAARA